MYQKIKKLLSLFEIDFTICISKNNKAYIYTKELNSNICFYLYLFLNRSITILFF